MVVVVDRLSLSGGGCLLRFDFILLKEIDELKLLNFIKIIILDLSNFQELVAHSGSDRNWKGMFIATLVILAVLGLILLSVIWMTPPEDLTPIGDKISFNDFLSNNLSGGLFNGTWISGKQTIQHLSIK